MRITLNILDYLITGRRNLGMVLPALCVASVLTACQQPEDKHLELVPINYKDRHPIQVTKHTREFSVTVARGAERLSSGQKVRLRRYLHAYKHEASGRLSVTIPEESDNDPEVKRILADIKQHASTLGIAPALLVVHPNGYGGNTSSTIRFRYGYAKAKADKCGEWPSNLAENYTNLNYYNFGCSQQRNLAAMIADPNDLIRQRNMRDRASERRDIIWDKYLKGESTISTRSPDEKGTVSEVAK